MKLLMWGVIKNYLGRELFGKHGTFKE